jgi:hypothetical protein
MKRLVSIIAVICWLAITGLAQTQRDLFVGTWELNLEKSQYSPGPAPRELTRTVRAQGDGIQVSYKGVASDGSRIADSYTAKFDGKDYPDTGTGTPNGADTFALKRIDSHTYEMTAKKAGKVVLTGRAAVSKDGRVTTITTQGTNAKGLATHNVAVLDKQ